MHLCLKHFHAIAGAQIYISRLLSAQNRRTSKQVDLDNNLRSFGLYLMLRSSDPVLHSDFNGKGPIRHFRPRDQRMPSPNCSTVKSALTELKEILSRSGSNSLNTKNDNSKIFADIADLEAIIASIEEKSFVSEDYTEDMGVPIITGLTAPAV